jgi:hypothetical protein
MRDAFQRFSLLVVVAYAIRIDPVASTQRILVSLHGLRLTVCGPIQSRLALCIPHPCAPRWRRCNDRSWRGYRSRSWSWGGWRRYGSLWGSCRLLRSYRAHCGLHLIHSLFQGHVPREVNQRADDKYFSQRPHRNATSIRSKEPGQFQLRDSRI